MVNVIGVRFKPAGKTYYFDPLDFDIKQGDSVIVETSRGIEYGEVVMSKKTIQETFKGCYPYRNRRRYRKKQKEQRA